MTDPHPRPATSRIASATDGGTATTILRDSPHNGHDEKLEVDLDYFFKGIDEVVQAVKTALTGAMPIGGTAKVLAVCEQIVQLKKEQTNTNPQPTDKAADLLDEAKKIVTGARRQAYGNPEDNFACIAELWDTYLHRKAELLPSMDDLKIDSRDVAVMVILMKAARLAESPDHHDSAVDIAGYAACLARVQK